MKFTLKPLLVLAFFHSVIGVVYTANAQEAADIHEPIDRAVNVSIQDRLIVFSENDKYGYKNKSGNVVIKAKYTEAEPFIDGLNCAIVKKGKRYGVINAAGKFMVKAQYNELTHTHKNHFLINQGDRYGVIDLFNNIIIEPNYSEIIVDSNFYVCRWDDSWIVKNLEGKTLLRTCYHIKYIGSAFAVLEDKDANKLWFQRFKKKQQDVFEHIGYDVYDEINKLSNDTYLVSTSLDYYIAGTDGWRIEDVDDCYIDVEKWEQGEWQYALYREEPGGCFIRYNTDCGQTEKLSLDQFFNYYGNPWEELFSTQYVDQYSNESQNFLVSNYLGLSPLYSPNFPKADTEITENSGGNSYVHYVFRRVDLGELQFIALRHVVSKDPYLYVINKNKKSIYKKIAYSEFASFADLSGAGIQIYGIATLSNGDVLLTAEANIVTGYDTYMRDPVYINIQGQPVAIDNGGTYRNYHRDDVTVVFVLDGKTFDLKHSRIMPHEYDNIYVSEYNGFFAYKSDYYGNFAITTENPILKFTNSCREDWSFAPSGGEGINCMVENSEYIYMGGYTKNRGYVGYKNPYICKIDLKTGTMVKSHSYKLKDGSIILFKGDCAFTNGVKSTIRDAWGSPVYPKYSFSLLDSFEEGDIGFVSVSSYDCIFTGLVYNDEYWLIPPVLHNQEAQTYAGWTIYPPVQKFNTDSKKIVSVYPKKEYNEILTY